MRLWHCSLQSQNQSYNRLNGICEMKIVYFIEKTYQKASISASETCEDDSMSDLFPHRNILAFSAYVTISKRCWDRTWNDAALSSENTNIAASANL